MALPVLGAGPLVLRLPSTVGRTPSARSGGTAGYGDAVLRIADLTYLVRDLDETITWFTDVLGFEIRSDEDRGPGRRRVVIGPDGGGPGLVLKPSESDVVGRQAGGSVAYFVHTDDFTSVHARLVQAGTTFRGDVRHEPWGTVVVFEDLHGNPWDLIQPPA